MTAALYPAGGSGRIVVRFDVDGDGDVDQNDVNLILAARNTAAGEPYDRRDVNGDGVLNALDARLVTLSCSRARCAARADSASILSRVLPCRGVSWPGLDARRLAART